MRAARSRWAGGGAPRPASRPLCSPIAKCSLPTLLPHNTNPLHPNHPPAHAPSPPSQVTAKGRLETLHVTTAVGNMHGLIGIGMASGSELQQVMLNSLVSAYKSVVPVPLYRAHTIYHPVDLTIRKVRRGNRAAAAARSGEALAAACGLGGAPGSGARAHAKGRATGEAGSDRHGRRSSGARWGGTKQAARSGGAHGLRPKHCAERCPRVPESPLFAQLPHPPP